MPGVVRTEGVDFNYKQALTFLPPWARGVQVFANATSQRVTGDDTVAFGSTVTITRKGRQQTFRIVGVDEADASNGMISHRSPMAQAILGARPGDIVEAPEPLGEIDILSTQGRN